MEKYGRVLAVAMCIGIALSLVSCKPVAYYLERVYKAQGTVTDAGTGTPLESVEVSLGSYQYSELSNGLGDYEMEMAEGTWTLVFTKDGYQPLTVSSVTVGPTKQRVKVDAALTPVAAPAPEFVGQWAVSMTSPIEATITWTLTSTTLHAVIEAGALGGSILDADISGIDETLHHFVLTYTSITSSGGFVAYEEPGDFVSVLYEVNGNTFTGATGAINSPVFPTELGSNALTFTRVQ
jgi:hypothetical protein